MIQPKMCHRTRDIGEDLVGMNTVLCLRCHGIAVVAQHTAAYPCH